MIENRDKPFYSKKQIINAINSGKIIIDPRALVTAENDFGWKCEDICKALKALKQKDWCKSEKRYDNPSILVDFYRAKDLIGENVFTHFSFDGDTLIVDSFKEE